MPYWLKLERPPNRLCRLSRGILSGSGPGRGGGDREGQRLGTGTGIVRVRLQAQQAWHPVQGEVLLDALVGLLVWRCCMLPLLPGSTCAWDCLRWLGAPLLTPMSLSCSALRPLVALLLFLIRRPLERGHSLGWDTRAGREPETCNKTLGEGLVGEGKRRDSPQLHLAGCPSSSLGLAAATLKKAWVKALTLAQAQTIALMLTMLGLKSRARLQR